MSCDLVIRGGIVVDGTGLAARPRDVIATIVNGGPIVMNGKLTSALPGQVLRPVGTRREA